MMMSFVIARRRALWLYDRFDDENDVELILSGAVAVCYFFTVRQFLQGHHIIYRKKLKRCFFW